MDNYPRWSFKRRFLYHIFFVLVPAILLRILRYEVKGKENIPPEGVGTLVVVNHLSHLDPFLMVPPLKPQKRIVHVMASAAFMRIRALSWVKYLGAFPIERGPKRIRGIRYSQLLLQDGQTVIIFPEGERSRLKGRMNKPRVGAGSIAHGVRPKAVIPVFIWGTDKVIPIGKLSFRWWLPIFVRYGKPMDLERFYNQPAGMETSMAIAEEMVNNIRNVGLKLREELHTRGMLKED